MRIALSAVIAAVVLFLPPGGAEEAIHERIEWSDVWITNADRDTDKPRVLLIGDSIVRGYYNGVEKELGDRANCARFTTSKFAGHPDFLDELGLILRRFSFDVIHVNNGLHGWDYTEDQYREAIRDLLAMLKREAPDAKLVWCMSTPWRDSQDLSRFDEEKNPRVQARNAIAAELAAEAGIPITDLYALSADRQDHFASDGVHYNEEGRAAQATLVAEAIAKQLERVQF